MEGRDPPPSQIIRDERMASFQDGMDNRIGIVAEAVAREALAEALRGKRVPTESDWTELAALIDERRFRRRVWGAAGGLVGAAKTWLLALAAIFSALAIIAEPVRAQLKGVLLWLLG